MCVVYSCFFFIDVYNVSEIANELVLRGGPLSNTHTQIEKKKITIVYPLILPYIRTRFFFVRLNKLYKNTQAEICLRIKNKLRTITRLKF